MKYDIFISYRRTGGKEIARPLKQAFTSKGYKVFLDFDELKDGIFNDKIFDAINDTPIFMVVLSEHSLDRCLEEDDWVRKEIEYAISKSKHIIPINPDKQFKSFPEGLPKELIDNLGQHQFSVVDTEQLFEDSINKIIKDRIEPIIGRKSYRKRFVGFVSLCVIVVIIGLLSLFTHKNNADYEGFTKTQIQLIKADIKSLSSQELLNKGDSILYLSSGDSVAQKVAVRYFEESAKAGNVIAMKKMAECYEKGLGLKLNYSQAFEWYKKAADSGDVNSQAKMGIYLEEGLLGDADASQAFKYYLAAAGKNDPDGIYKLASLYLYGNGVEKDLDKAIQYYSILAEKQYPNAWNNLGVCYEQKGDYIKALEWYSQAANEGVPTSQANVGLYYYYGYGVPINYAEAVKWFQAAANQMEPSALNYLGNCYQQGTGVDKDDKKAAELYRSAAELNHGYAQSNYGFCLLNGQGVEQNSEEAFKWFYKSANNGNAYGFFNLGLCYENGFGTAINAQEAKRCYNLAAEQGVEQAREALERMAK